MTFCAGEIFAWVALVCTVTLITPTSSSAQGSRSTPASLENRRQQLLSLFDEEWQYGLRTNPEWATILGDTRYNDRLSDNSPEFFQSDLEQKR